jgi:Protein of unknown function (DUF3224)
MIIERDLKLKIESWDEKPYRELDDGRKFTKADVVLGGDGDIESVTFEAIMFYAADGTSTFLSLMQISGKIGGRSGSFVLEGRGTYDGTTASSSYTVIPGSGSSELDGITGTAESASTQDDYPLMPLKLQCELH